MLRYEDLLADTKGTCERLATFLGTEIEVPDLLALGHNSSFSKGARKGITETETWICQRLCRQEMGLLGYEARPASPKFSDMLGFIGLSLKFTVFHAMRTMGSPDARKRMFTFVRGLSR